MKGMTRKKIKCPNQQTRMHWLISARSLSSIKLNFANSVIILVVSYSPCETLSTTLLRLFGTMSQGMTIQRSVGSKSLSLRVIFSWGTRYSSLVMKIIIQMKSSWRLSEPLPTSTTRVACQTFGIWNSKTRLSTRLE
jgi:hypothetical protein